ncbi:hypothetical protein MTR62_07620 [Novosphingobium sp. 1949]|uniref:Uncharacterized protein n=1 Tax=Novosphingobium organovorum TaxID=2930092 RepID=A0ABT0BC84_9SPHN|nr:hypothetical protein [Novosphingobium organovorum]MCJ2182559.1 hypothetical protein [Novosphingobium organovorum]
MTGITAFMLRRRALREQRVLRILRGLAGTGAAQAEAHAEITALGGDLRALHALHALASRLGEAALEIREPEAQWLSADEVRVLAWLARAQRKLLPPIAPVPGRPSTANAEQAARLTAAICPAAQALCSMGIRLPALAMTNAVALSHRPM